MLVLKMGYAPDRVRRNVLSDYTMLVTLLDLGLMDLMKERMENSRRSQMRKEADLNGQRAHHLQFQRSLDVEMRSEVVSDVLEMGLDQDRVQKAVKRQLQEHGRGFTTRCELVTLLDLMEEEEKRMENSRRSQMRGTEMGAPKVLRTPEWLRAEDALWPPLIAVPPTEVWRFFSPAQQDKLGRKEVDLNGQRAHHLQFQRSLDVEMRSEVVSANVRFLQNIQEATAQAMKEHRCNQLFSSGLSIVKPIEDLLPPYALPSVLSTPPASQASGLYQPGLQFLPCGHHNVSVCMYGSYCTLPHGLSTKCANGTVAGISS